MLHHNMLHRNIATCYIATCYITTCYITTCYITTCYITTCYITTCYIATCYITTCYIATCYIETGMSTRQPARTEQAAAPEALRAAVSSPQQRHLRQHSDGVEGEDGPHRPPQARIGHQQP